MKYQSTNKDHQKRWLKETKEQLNNPMPNYYENYPRSSKWEIVVIVIVSIFVVIAFFGCVAGLIYLINILA